MSSKRLLRANSVLDLIGATPLIRLNRVVPPGAATVWAKLGRTNPGGSIKDRVALAMIEAAQRDGKLKPDSIIVEPSSGNTGIGLALVGRLMGAFQWRGDIAALQGLTLGVVYTEDPLAIWLARLVSIGLKGKVTVLAERYANKKLNSPNDLWLAPNGGIYFTDPRYGNRDGMEQDGEHVYYLTPDRKKVIRVIDDMVYVYTINADGTLSDKKLFAPEGSDGMTIDSEGHVYLTRRAVSVYDSGGKKVETIEVPEGPANVCFGGKDKQTLFITARTSLYSIRMRVKGL